uniref:Uncharacterized protein n=1 Tax=Siphoviridae sp. ctwHj1 TaxID=2825727 RepID=A0A8S5U690_9CAUD|nr:MAG TPA: hypothetical protein [Siphoviridae sp. ctwHj1]
MDLISQGQRHGRHLRWFRPKNSPKKKGRAQPRPKSLAGAKRWKRFDNKYLHMLIPN